MTFYFLASRENREYESKHFASILVEPTVEEIPKVELKPVVIAESSVGQVVAPESLQLLSSCTTLDEYDTVSRHCMQNSKNADDNSIQPSASALLC